MAEIDLVDVTKRFPDGTTAVDDVTFTIQDGEFFILVGPSGCGKSTLLNMIVGLEEITEGELKVDGKVVNDVDPKDRNMAMVFQSYALYPHMTVRENISFPLRLAKMDEAEIAERVDEAARILQLSELLDRKPANLSGGQRQRVAMGRAIVREPAAFLMDEPLSNLDAKLRVQTRTQIARLQNRLKTTTVYVTHDQTEAMTLGDRIALMRRGVVQQLGTPRELYEQPANLFVAGFIGSPAMNFLRARGVRVPGQAAHGGVRPARRGGGRGRRRRPVADRRHPAGELRGRRPGAGGRPPPRAHVHGHDRGRRVDGVGAVRLLHRRRGGGGVGAGPPRRPHAPRTCGPSDEGTQVVARLERASQARQGRGAGAVARRPRPPPVRPRHRGAPQPAQQEEASPPAAAAGETSPSPSRRSRRRRQDQDRTERARTETVERPVPPAGSLRRRRRRILRRPPHPPVELPETRAMGSGKIPGSPSTIARSVVAHSHPPSELVDDLGVPRVGPQQTVPGVGQAQVGVGLRLVGSHQSRLPQQGQGRLVLVPEPALAHVGPLQRVPQRLHHPEAPRLHPLGQAGVALGPGDLDAGPLLGGERHPFQEVPLVGLEGQVGDPEVGRRSRPG